MTRSNEADRFDEMHNNPYSSTTENIASDEPQRRFGITVFLVATITPALLAIPVAVALLLELRNAKEEHFHRDLCWLIVGFFFIVLSIADVCWFAAAVAYSVVSWKKASIVMRLSLIGICIFWGLLLVPSVFCLTFLIPPLFFNHHVELH